MNEYGDFLKRLNKMMREEFSDVDCWALLVDDVNGVPWDVAGFDIDRVATQWVANRTKEMTA